MSEAAAAPIVVERLTYGKPVLRDSGAVPFGRDYEVTSCSHDLAPWKEAIMRPSRLVAGGMQWGPDWIAPQARRIGCLLIIPVERPDRPERGIVAARVRFRSEGGEETAGRPYLQSTMWYVGESDWRRGYSALLPKIASSLRAEPDNLEDLAVASPDGVQAQWLEVAPRAKASGAPREFIPGKVAVSLASHLNGSDGSASNSSAPLFVGDKDCEGESSFLTCLAEAFGILETLTAGETVPMVGIASGFCGPVEGLRIIHRVGEAIAPLAAVSIETLGAARRMLQRGPNSGSPQSTVSPAWDPSDIVGGPADATMASFHARESATHEQWATSAKDVHSPAREMFPDLPPAPTARHAILAGVRSSRILLDAYEAWERREISVFDNPQLDDAGKLCILAISFGASGSLEFAALHVVDWALCAWNDAEWRRTVPSDCHGMKKIFEDKIVDALIRRAVLPPDEYRQLLNTKELRFLVGSHDRYLRSLGQSSKLLLNFASLPGPRKRVLVTTKRELLEHCFAICRAQLERVDSLEGEDSVIENVQARFNTVRIDLEQWEKYLTD